MLTIKDLSATQELDHSAMSDVRGGSANVFSGNGQLSSQNAYAGLVAVNEGNQSQNVFNSAVDYTDLDVLKFAIGGGNFVI